MKSQGREGVYPVTVVPDRRLCWEEEVWGRHPAPGLGSLCDIGFLELQLGQCWEEIMKKVMSFLGSQHVWWWVRGTGMCICVHVCVCVCVVGRGEH